MAAKFFKGIARGWVGDGGLPAATDQPAVETTAAEGTKSACADWKRWRGETLRKREAIGIIDAEAAITRGTLCDEELALNRSMGPLDWPKCRFCACLNGR